MAKISRQSTPKVGNRIRLMPGEKVSVGVDTHKKSYHVAVWSLDRDRLLATWVQAADPHRLVDRLRPHQEQVSWVVYEAGPTGYGLVRELRAAELHADVIAPSLTPSTPGQQAKSDRLDCRRLAEFAAKGLVRPIEVPTPQQEADRQILRLREQMAKKNRQVKSQIKSFLLLHGVKEPHGLDHWSDASVADLRTLQLAEPLRFCLDRLLEEMDHTASLVKKVTACLRAMAATKRHASGIALLQTTPGVGPLTAMTYRLELPRPERFDNSREVALMMGLAPHVRSSGMTRREGRLMRAGNPRLKAVLVEAAWRWIRKDPAAGVRYRRLVANTGNANKAIVAMARKLGIILWRMSLTGECYREAA